MDKRWKTPLLLLQGAVIVLLVWALSWFARDEFQSRHADDDMEPAAAHARTDGNAVLIDREAQEAAGIAVEKLKAAQYTASQRHFGVLADPRTLVEMRQRYLSLAAQIAAGDAQVQQRRAELARVEGLFNEGRNATQRDLEAARAALVLEEQRVGALQAERRAVVDGVRVIWGDALADRLGEKDSLLARAIAREVDLVQFSMPYGASPQRLHWRVGAAAAQDAGLAGTLVGRVPQALAGLQGETWLLTTAPSGLPAGTRLRVTADATQPLAGVNVPAAALLRFAGKTWVYLKTGPERFERHALAADRPLGDGLFSDAFKPGATVVTSGAQLLLSEEFRFAIKNENED